MCTSWYSTIVSHLNLSWTDRAVVLRRSRGVWLILRRKGRERSWDEIMIPVGG